MMKSILGLALLGKMETAFVHPLAQSCVALGGRNPITFAGKEITVPTTGA
jgi:hypothetical protein